LLNPDVVKPRLCSIHAIRALTALGRALPNRSPSRGFTLLELLVTVTLVGILVVMAIPSASLLMRDRRTNQAAHEAAIFYRRARSMAMGRGAAVLVRYSSANRGRIEIREALSTIGALCANLPATSCTATNWDANNTNNRLLDTFGPALGPYDNVQLEFHMPDNSTPGAVDICFTPLGRTLFRASSVNTTPFAPLTQVPSIRSVPLDGTGRTRTVLIVPSGVSRVAL
jgi:prepilin-type N-terminal cleavage/methylation domain-containing protein